MRKGEMGEKRSTRVKFGLVKEKKIERDKENQVRKRGKRKETRDREKTKCVEVWC